MKHSVWLIPLFAAALSTGDLSGRWAGVIEVADQVSGTTMKQPVRAEFEQKENAISGRIGREGDTESEAISNGRLDGKRLVFEVNSAHTSGAIKFELTVEGNRLEGNMKGALDSGPISGKVHLARDAK